jgi:hypothetical protein
VLRAFRIFRTLGVQVSTVLVIELRGKLLFTMPLGRREGSLSQFKADSRHGITKRRKEMRTSSVYSFFRAKWKCRLPDTINLAQPADEANFVTQQATAGAKR